MRSLFDNPVLLLIGLALPVLAVALGVAVLYWVVRSAVRHGAREADGARLEQRAPDDRSGSGG